MDACAGCPPAARCPAFGVPCCAAHMADALWRGWCRAYRRGVRARKHCVHGRGRRSRYLCSSAVSLRKPEACDSRGLSLDTVDPVRLAFLCRPLLRRCQGMESKSLRAADRRDRCARSSGREVKRTPEQRQRERQCDIRERPGMHLLCVDCRTVHRDEAASDSARCERTRADGCVSERGHVVGASLALSFVLSRPNCNVRTRGRRLGLRYPGGGGYDCQQSSNDVSRSWLRPVNWWHCLIASVWARVRQSR